MDFKEWIRLEDGRRCDAFHGHRWVHPPRRSEGMIFAMSRRLAQPTYQIRPLYRREYERIVELGLFDDEKVELLGQSRWSGCA